MKRVVRPPITHHDRRHHPQLIIAPQPVDGSVGELERE